VNKRTLIIEQNEKDQSGKVIKTRQFQAELLAYVQGDMLWEGGKAETDNIRPVWAMFAGSEQELRPFVANLQSGKRAEVPTTGYSSHSAPTRYEFLRRSGYRYLWQRVASEEGQNAALVTVYLPELFRLDPGMLDPNLCQFVMLPPRWWVEAQKEKLIQDIDLCGFLLSHAKAVRLKSFGKVGFTDKDLLAQLPQAAYFAAYLDRRTKNPLPDSLDFYLQLYFYALREGIATRHAPLNNYERIDQNEKWSWARHQGLGYHETDINQAGLLPGVAVHMPQTRLDDFLAWQVQLYFSVQQKLSARAENAKLTQLTLPIIEKAS